MLESTGTEYEYISDSSRFGEVMSKWGAKGNCFAPPVVVDGDTIVSQSTAASLYLGNKLGLNSMENFDVVKAMQFKVRLFLLSFLSHVTHAVCLAKLDSSTWSTPLRTIWGRITKTEPRSRDISRAIGTRRS